MTEKYLLTKNNNTVTILKKNNCWNYKKQFGSTLIENFDISDNKLNDILFELKELKYKIIIQPESSNDFTIEKFRKKLDTDYQIVSLPFEQNYENVYSFTHSVKNIEAILCKYCMSYTIKDGKIKAHVKNNDNNQVLLKKLKPNLPIGILLEIYIYENNEYTNRNI